VLVRELLEVVQDLFLNDGRETLDLLDEDTFVHFDLANVTNCLNLVLDGDLFINVHFILAFVGVCGVHAGLSELQFLSFQVKKTALLRNVVFEDRGAKPN
jgi:hypothetical protein